MGIYDYDKDAKPKTSKEQRDAMMKKFLDKGSSETLSSPTTTLGNISSWVANLYT